MSATDLQCCEDDDTLMSTFRAVLSVPGQYSRHLFLPHRPAAAQAASVRQLSPPIL